MAYIKDGELIVDKGYFKVKEFIDAIEKVESDHLLLHFRSASPGMVKNSVNCHPFEILTREDKETKKPRFHYAVAHNGRLEWRHSSKASDTNCFVNDVLEEVFERDPWFLEQDSGMMMMERTINNKNKMVVMRLDTLDNKVSVHIVNESEGVWDKGCWYSNTSYIKPINNWDKYRDTVESFKGKTVFVHGHWIRWDEPDSNGWFWSFVLDKWKHNLTQEVKDWLSYRDPPYFPHWRTFMQPHNQLPAGATRTTAFQAQLKLQQEWNPTDEDEDIPPVIGTSHLTQKEKGLLCQYAYNYLRKIEGFTRSQIRKMTVADKIEALRDWAYDQNPETIEWEADVMDTWIVAQIKGGFFKIEEPKPATTTYVTPSEDGELNGMGYGN